MEQPVSIRIRKPDMATIKQGDWVTVTIDAAPRNSKPWQARMGSRLVARDMILLTGLADNVPRFIYHRILMRRSVMQFVTVLNMTLGQCCLRVAA